MKKSRIVRAITAFSLSVGLGIAGVQAVASEKYVAATQIVEHPALDAARQGVLDELNARGYEVGKNLKWTYESAQGNTVTAGQIARKLSGERPNVIVAIATPSAQAAATAARGIPVVFSAVTDPVGAKLVASLEKPGKNVTGVTDMLPVAKHVELMKNLIPGIKTIGVIYNPGEANSVTTVNLVKEEAPKQGLEVVTAAATKSSEVQMAARSLIGKADIVYLPTDNTVISAAEAIIRVGEQNKLPIIAADTDTVKRGAIAAMGFNYYDMGRQTGAIVARILEGEKPAEISVETVDNMELYLNLSAAKRMGVEVPQALRESAKEIIGE